MRLGEISEARNRAVDRVEKSTEVLLGFHVHVLCIYMRDRPSINNAPLKNLMNMQSKSYIPEDFF